MGPTVEKVPFGRSATEALARHVGAAQADDPLAPVTVVVPSNLAGLTARRLLASGEMTATERGMANVSFTTPFQLAARLGGPRLAAEGRVPLSNPVLGAAVRAQLADAPGPFAPVADHHATEQALTRLYGELSRARPATWDALLASPHQWTASVVAVVRDVSARLGSRYGEDDLARAARMAVEEGDGPSTGTVILHLVDDLPPAFVDLFAALADRGPCLSVEGGPVADPVPTDVIAVPDTDEEVRTALRSVMQAAERGTPLDRIGIIHPSVEPYARTLVEQLEGSSIPYSAAAARPLGATVAGRTVRRLLALVDGGLGRDDLIDLVAGGPVRTPSGRRAPAAAWDAVSRSAGVVGGADGWVDKLERHVAALEARDDSRSNQVAVTHTRSLLEFVTWLAPLVDPGGLPTSWADRAGWAQGVLGDLLGPEHRRTTWPDDEHAASLAVAAAIERLGELDAFDPQAPFAAFSRAFIDEIDRPAGRHGTFGEGIVVAPLGAAVGLDLDVVIVIGLAEGSVPSRRNEDPLVPDSERARAVDAELPLRRDQAAREERLVQAALAAGRRRRVLIRPWGDHRKGRTRYPSRWCPEGADERPSFWAGLAAPTPPHSTADLDLRTLSRHVDAGGAPGDHVAADAIVTAGLSLAAARASTEFTRFDGDLGGVERPSPLEERPFSSTRLETWAKCPRRYFLGDELDLGVLERPERIIEISPLERGSLVHEVLERFMGEVVARPEGERPQPGDPWGPDDHRRLIEVAEEVCDEVEAKGLTGRPLLWRLQRFELLSDFDRLLAHDDDLRAAWGAVPAAVEQAFGMDGEEPALVPLADGRTVAFRGKADRVDRAPDGTAVVVDYKTGKLGDAFKEIEVDPVVRGEKLQLGLYAEAVAGDGSAASWYWFATSVGEFKTVGFEYGEVQRGRLRHVLTEIVDGIEAGVFPARSGDYNAFFRSHDHCGWCDFDDLCPTDRHESWVRISGEPALRRYRDLAEPIADEDGT